MPIGTTEILLVLIVILLLFGAKRLPELARSLGEMIAEFRGSLRKLEGKRYQG